MADDNRAQDFESMGPETFDSPHEQFRRLRAECPVAWSNGWGGFWALTKYDDIINVLSDPATFTTTIQNVVPRVATSRRRPPLHLDPPDHTPYRRAIAPLFRDSRMALWEPAVRRMAVELLAPVLEKGEADICREFSYRLPIHVLAEFFNIPEKQANQVRDIGSAYNIALQERNDTLVQETSERLYGIAKDIIELRKREPLSVEDDPTTALLAARHEGQPLPDDMILGTIRQMLVVGIIAPTTAIGSIMVHLARHTEHQAYLRAHPERVGDAVEELLRLYTPYRGFARTARRDVEIGGRKICAGEAIALVFTSANRDEDRFRNADQFDIDRPVRDHVTFGRGPHNCPGAGLGRLQIRVALEEVLARTKGFEIAGDIEMTRWPEYGPLTVPLRFWEQGKGARREDAGAEKEGRTLQGSPAINAWLTRRGALAAGTATLAVVGCGRAPFDPTQLTIAMPTFAEGTFLPWTGGGQRKAFLDAMYDYLCVIDPATGEPGPGLATDWSVTPDGLTWTFRIRPGVQFQRGYGEATSADAAFSIRQIIRPSARAGPSSPLRRLIKEIATPDARTLVIQLTRPDPELAKGYFANAQQVGIVCARHVEEVGEAAANKSPVGSGPYALDFFRRDSEIRLRVREDAANFWRQKPAFETLVFRAVPEVSTRVAMMKTGEADIAPISYDDITDVERNGLAVRSIPQSWSPVIRLGGLVQEGDRYEAMNPWADVRVRQAMNYAIDKDTIIRRIFHGQGRIAASDTPVEAWSGLAPYEYDPPRARELLTEAGYPDGFPVTLKAFATTPGAELPVVAQAVALYWRAVGIEVSTELIDWTSLRSAWTSGAARNYVWTHRGFPFTSAQNGLEAGFDATSVFSAFSTPELQTMLDAHADELDLAKRREKLAEIGAYLRDQAANVFIAHINEPYAASRKVGEWTITSSNALNFEGIQPAVFGETAA